MTDQSTAAVAASAVSSPVWLPWLSATSEVAAIVVPILGAVWLVVQIYAKLVDVRLKLSLRKKPDEE